MYGTQTIRRVERAVVRGQMVEGFSRRGVRQALAKARRDQPAWFTSAVTTELKRRGVSSTLYDSPAVSRKPELRRLRSDELPISLYSGYCAKDHFTDETRMVLLDGQKTTVGFCAKCAAHFKVRRRPVFY